MLINSNFGVQWAFRISESFAHRLKLFWVFAEVDDWADNGCHNDEAQNSDANNESDALLFGAGHIHPSLQRLKRRNSIVDLYIWNLYK